MADLGKRAPPRLDLEQLLADAKARVALMSPEEYEAMMQAQCESWVRAMTTPCEHGVLDYEQCPKCRGWEVDDGKST